MEEIQQTQRPKRVTRMSAKRKAALENKENESKRRRTFNDFFTFCSFVLEYEEQLALSEHHTPHIGGSNVVTNSAGESSTSTTPTSSGSSAGGSDASDMVREDTPTSSDSLSDGDTSNEKLEYTSDDESWNLVTCFCRRPFAGRPMIECSVCKTWVHLFCAKIRKGRVPDVYTCPRCQTSSDSHTSPISTGQS